MLKPFFNDYKLHIIEVGWLSDEQIARLHGDFRHLAEYLRAKRLGTAYEGSTQKIQHLTATLELLRVVSGDDSFKEIQPLLLQQEKEQGGATMCDVVQRIKQDGIAIGESRGIAIGEVRGENRMIALFSKLFAAGRTADAERATTDRAYLQQLFDEYQK